MDAIGAGLLAGLLVGAAAGVWLWRLEHQIGKMRVQRDRARADRDVYRESADDWRREHIKTADALTAERNRSARMQELLVKFGRPGAAKEALGDLHAEWSALVGGDS